MSKTPAGLAIAVVAAFSFGTSGAFVKPMLEAGWSPAAGVTARALVGGVILLPIALLAVRGNWSGVWRARWRILAMGLIGVAGCQLMYFAAIARIPVSSAILVEYLAPLLLVGFVWATTRRMPKVVVLIGSVVSVVGLAMVVSPGKGTSLDSLGLIFAGLAAIGCAIYYVIVGHPSDDLPPVALAAFGLLVGGTALGLVGLAGVVPFVATFDTVPVLGSPVPWWVPLALLGVIGTALAYFTSITASGMLGSRLASFAGLLEVVAAAAYAWVLLGEAMTVPQLLGARSSWWASPSFAAKRLSPTSCWSLAAISSSPHRQSRPR
ncbi:EamA family transporter [Rhodococcus sp. LB1]|uniref:EamA family transporter n=1 Tax=Rhodococcus sp. LB1 TaxID=1807499 RepID=UPI000A6C052B|nr:EamA family transporter [Rhodococcus sp. LB1]